MLLNYLKAKLNLGSWDNSDWKGLREVCSPAQSRGFLPGERVAVKGRGEMGGTPRCC